MKEDKNIKEYAVPIKNITWDTIKESIEKMLKEEKEKKCIVYINGKVPQVMKIGKKKGKEK